MDLCNGSRIFFQPMPNWWATDANCNPITNPYSLQGRTITVGALECPPFFRTSKSGENITHDGFSVELLLILSRYLGFRYYYKMEELFGTKENLTWNGLIGLLDKKIIDVTLVGLTETQERLEVADFSSHFGESYEVVVIRNSDDKNPPYEVSHYLKPFGTKVWLTVVMTWLLASCTLGFMLGVSLNGDLRSSDHPVLKSIRNQLFSLWLLLSVILQRPDFTYLPRNRSLSSTLLSFFIFAVIVHAIYSSLITASFTVKKNDILFNDLDDVLDDGGYGICSMPYHTSYDEMKKAKDGTLHRAWKKLISDKGSIVMSLSEGFNKAYSEKYVFFVRSGVGQYVVNSNCSLEILKQYYLKTSDHIVFQKHSPLKEIFNMKLLSLRSSGVLQKLHQSYLNVNVQRSCNAIDVRSKLSIKIHQTIGPFLILALGVVFASTALFVEVTVGRHLAMRYGKSNENHDKPISAIKSDCSEEKVARLYTINETQDMLHTTKQIAADEEAITGNEVRFCNNNENQEILQSTKQVGSDEEAKR